MPDIVPWSPLTRQDFGTSARRWLSWAERHGDRHRIEWLIDGLLHSDEQLRSAAADELKALTQEVLRLSPRFPEEGARSPPSGNTAAGGENEGRGRFAS